MSELDLIEPLWPVPGHVRAAFSCRGGGVSAAPFDSLNVGKHVGDDPAAVERNRARLGRALQLPSEPIWLEQIHGAEVLSLAARPPIEPRFDAVVTREPGRVCVIQVADCMPVLFAAADGSVIGAAHAGWRGLAAGILEATVQALATPVSDLCAWMGPAIGPRHFEVGEEVRAAFTEPDPGAASAFAPNDRGRWMCDLYALARRRLAAASVRCVQGGGWCTFTDAGRFFSYRREPRCGRMAALIWLEPSGA